MFCPNCGANNSTEQNFCRTCGFNLEETAKSLLLQIPSAERAELLRREKSLERFGGFVWGGFGIVCLIGVGALLYTIFDKFVWSGKNPLVGILFAAFIIFATFSLIFVFFREDLKEKKKKLGRREQIDLPEAKITGKLLEDKPFEPARSVVENSTELLLTENKTRKFE